MKKLLLGLLLSMPFVMHAMDLDPAVMLKDNTKNMSIINDLKVLLSECKNGPEIVAQFVRKNILSLPGKNIQRKLYSQLLDDNATATELLGALTPEQQQELGKILWHAVMGQDGYKQYLERAKQEQNNVESTQDKQEPLSNKSQVEEGSQPQTTEKSNKQTISFFVNHKNQFLSMAALGAFAIATYKFVGWFINQAQKLEDMVTNAQAALEDVANSKEITFNVKWLTYLNDANKEALQTRITAFNIMLNAVKVGTGNSAALEQSFNQLKAIAEQCIKQINENPVKNTGILTTVAEKCKTFGSAVKYYAWDKWVACNENSTTA